MEKIDRTKLTRRLLPGDFNKLLKKEGDNHYSKLNNTEKDIVQPLRGFFPDPEKLVGEQDMGELDFLVFYFDKKEDYQLILEFFETPVSKKVSHPITNTKKLVKLVKNQINDKGK